MSNQTRIQSSMQSRFGLQLMVAIFCRFLLKTGRRFVYPFAALVSSALGVSLVAITMLLALNQVAAILSPLFGQMSDRWGYRTMMGWGLIVASVSMLAVGLLPSYTVLMFGLLAIGIGISICDPALHAYVGVRVPFAQRGQVMGLTELAWAGSSLVGIPVAGWLVQSYSWNMPFMVMGVLGLCGAMLLRGLLPASTHSYIPKKTRLISASRSLLQRPAVRAMLCYAFLVSCASDIFFVTYALWLADGFSMGVMALGLATVAIGLAELGGELLTATLADRLGLGRTMLVTLLVTAACYALLPLLGNTAMGAMVGIFLLCLAAEFNLVAAMSLSTEIQPNARATMMSWFQATSGLGHVVGVVAGGLIWIAGGITGVGLICAVLCLVSFFVVRWGLNQWQGVSAEEHDLEIAIGQWPEHSGQSSNQATLLLPIWYHQVWN